MSEEELGVVGAKLPRVSSSGSPCWQPVCVGLNGGRWGEESIGSPLWIGPFPSSSIKSSSWDMLKLVASSVTNSGICSNTNEYMCIYIYIDGYRVTYDVSRKSVENGKLRKSISRWILKSAKRDTINNGRYDSNFLVIYAERSFLVVVVEGRGGRKKKRGEGNDKWR